MPTRIDAGGTELAATFLLPARDGEGKNKGIPALPCTISLVLPMAVPEGLRATHR